MIGPQQQAIARPDHRHCGRAGQQPGKCLPAETPIEVADDSKRHARVRGKRGDERAKGLLAPGPLRRCRPLRSHRQGNRPPQNRPAGQQAMGPPSPHPAGRPGRKQTGVEARMGWGQPCRRLPRRARHTSSCCPLNSGIISDSTVSRNQARPIRAAPCPVMARGTSTFRSIFKNASIPRRLIQCNNSLVTRSVGADDRPPSRRCRFPGPRLHEQDIDVIHPTRRSRRRTQFL